MYPLFMVGTMMKKIIICASAVLLLICTCFKYNEEKSDDTKKLFIHEVVTANGSFQNADKEYYDWIELYNAGSDEINLSSYYLSDDLQNLKRWQFPEVSIPPMSYLLIYASGVDEWMENGELHTNFKLDCMGETLCLSSSEGEILDSLDLPEIPFDRSYGYSKEKENYVLFEKGTPGSENQGEYLTVCETENVKYSLPAGRYHDEILLKLKTTEKGAKIYYTLDGSIPTLESAVYEDNPLIINDRTFEKNRYTGIWTSPNDWDGQDGFSYNPKEQYKATVVKTRLYFPKENVWSEKVWTNTYLINADYTLPVVSLSVQEEDLFDKENGIYVPGKAYEEYLATTPEIDPEPRNRKGNYSEDRKVPGYLEYFTEDGSCAMENKVTMRICGNISRGSGMKSLTVYAWGDNQNGAFQYPIFGTDCVDIYGNTVSQFTSIRLRNFGNDWRRSKFRDALGQSLVTDLNMGTQGYQPCILLVNGEYFGLCEVRENRDEKFFWNHFGIAEGNLERVKIPDIGKVKETKAQREFLELVEYIRTNDLSIQENYDYVASVLDVEQFLDYVLIQLYLQNLDWLKNNCDFFRAAVPVEGSEREDGRWRVILYDVDYAINYEQENNYQTFFESEEYCAVMMKGLLKNKACKERFVQRFEELLSGTFETEPAIAKQQAMETQMAPEIEEDLSRWDVYFEGELVKSTSTPYWYEKMEDLRRFFRERPEYAREYFYSSLP